MTHKHIAYMPHSSQQFHATGAVVDIHMCNGEPTIYTHFIGRWHISQPKTWQRWKWTYSSGIRLSEWLFSIIVRVLGKISKNSFFQGTVLLNKKVPRQMLTDKKKIVTLVLVKKYILIINLCGKTIYLHWVRLKNNIV